MRKITQDAVHAFENAIRFKRDNTEIDVLLNVTIMKLFGNPIAYLYNDPDRTLSVTTHGWFTNVTKERLNGIPGIKIIQKNGVWYLNGNVWDGRLVDIK